MILSKILYYRNMFEEGYDLVVFAYLNNIQFYPRRVGNANYEAELKFASVSIPISVDSSYTAEEFLLNLINQPDRVKDKYSLNMDAFSKKVLSAANLDALLISTNNYAKSICGDVMLDVKELNQFKLTDLENIVIPVKASPAPKIKKS